MRVRGAVVVVALFCCFGAVVVSAQAYSQEAASASADKTSSEKPKTRNVSAAQLEHDFFTLLRSSDDKAFLAYVPAGGVNVGSNAQHLSRAEVEAQLTHHAGLYCKLFDSACLTSEIKLDQSNVRGCSYRELLTTSKDVHTAATETTRNGVRQAILVARMKNDNCAGVGLVDFIFNLQADGWKLFSIP
jgi:hypothetical protein